MSEKAEHTIRNFSLLLSAKKKERSRVIKRDDKRTMKIDQNCRLDIEKNKKVKGGENAN